MRRFDNPAPSTIDGGCGRGARLALSFCGPLLLLSAPAPAQFVKGLKIDAAVLASYDDNVYYSVDGQQFSSWYSSIVPHLSYRQEGGRLYLDVDYRGQGDIYFTFEPEYDTGIDYQTSNFYSNYLKLDLGYQLTDRVLFRLKDNLDNTNRPDFLMVDEVVYGQFIQNETARGDDLQNLRTAGAVRRLRVQLHRLLPSSDDSANHDFINSQANLIKLAAYYHLSGFTKASFNYYRSMWTFPDQEVLDYTDDFFTFGLDKQFNDQWLVHAEAGVQDRSMEESTAWDSGSNFFFKAEVLLQRERSDAKVAFERGRSLAPNYSADFYMDYILYGTWTWRPSGRDTLRFELGTRWNSFERYPADWEDPSAGLRDDNYIYTQVGYQHQIRERLVLEGKYQYMSRDSNNADFTFGKNQVQFGVRFQLFQ